MAVEVLQLQRGVLGEIEDLESQVRRAQAGQYERILRLFRDGCGVRAYGSDVLESLAGELSLALNISYRMAATRVGVAFEMGRMPGVFGLFARGVVSEQVVRAVAGLTPDVADRHMGRVDEALVPLLPGLTVYRARKTAAAVIASIDPDAADERAERARAGAEVVVLPEPDGVASLLVRGPAEQVVAAFSCLDRWAVAARAAGDERSRGQIMFGTLVERVTGAQDACSVDVELQLVMDASTLVAGVSDQGSPVLLAGYGPVSPVVADQIVAAAPNVWVRRLLTDPVDGRLVSSDASRRLFKPVDRVFVRDRDRYCRRPGCDSRIRDVDHITDYQYGGATVMDNAQGLCRKSHMLKHLPGWNVTGTAGAVTWHTPLGRVYESRPPRVLPKHAPPASHDDDDPG